MVNEHRYEMKLGGCTMMVGLAVLTITHWYIKNDKNDMPEPEALRLVFLLYVGIVLTLYGALTVLVHYSWLRLYHTRENHHDDATDQQSTADAADRQQHPDG